MSLLGKVCRAIARPGAQGGWVRDGVTGAIAVPHELFVREMSAWVRADGSLVMFDIQRDFRRLHPGPVGRWRLRRAIRKFGAPA